MFQLQLVVGHRAANRFAEAAQAMREAEEYFHMHGADSYVAIYRAQAASDAAAGAEFSPRVAGAELAETEPSVTPGGGAGPPR